MELEPPRTERRHNEKLGDWGGMLFKKMQKRLEEQAEAQRARVRAEQAQILDRSEWQIARKRFAGDLAREAELMTKFEIACEVKSTTEVVKNYTAVRVFRATRESTIQTDHRYAVLWEEYQRKSSAQYRSNEDKFASLVSQMQSQSQLIDHANDILGQQWRQIGMHRAEAIIKSAEYPSNWSSLRTTALERDDYRCSNCGKQQNETQLEVHHIVPLARGGSNMITNLITLCDDCHLRADRKRF